MQDCQHQPEEGSQFALAAEKVGQGRLPRTVCNTLPHNRLMSSRRTSLVFLSARHMLPPPLPTFVHFSVCLGRVGTRFVRPRKREKRGRLSLLWSAAEGCADGVQIWRRPLTLADLEGEATRQMLVGIFISCVPLQIAFSATTLRPLTRSSANKCKSGWM